MCDNIEKFIEEVQKHDCIYNLQSPLYKNFYLKQDLWMKIGKSVGITADDARKKWKSIRDSYKRYKQKKNQPSGSETVFNKPYKYADSLRFLDDIQNKRSNSVFKVEENYDEEPEGEASHLNQPEPEVHYDVSIVNEPELSNEADFEIENFDLNDYVKKIDGPASTNTTNPPLTAPNNTNNDNSHTNTYRPENDQLKKKKYDKEALIHEACQEMTSLLQNAKKHFTPPSSNQVFFNSLALQVEEANLPPLSQMRLQQRILEIVTMEIVNHQQNNSLQQL